MTICLPNRVIMYGKNVKLWGQTQSVCVTDSIHVAVAHMKQGGYSSKHMHEYNWNRFVVQSGTLRITIYKNDNEEVIDLGHGDILDIEPLVIHRMEALTDVDLVEIYWTDEDEFVVDDIVRYDSGGIKCHRSI